MQQEQRWRTCLLQWVLLVSLPCVPLLFVHLLHWNWHVFWSFWCELEHGTSCFWGLERNGTLWFWCCRETLGLACSCCAHCFQWYGRHREKEIRSLRQLRGTTKRHSFCQPNFLVSVFFRRSYSLILFEWERIVLNNTNFFLIEKIILTW